MPSLAEIQRELASHILAGESAKPDASTIHGWLELPLGIDAETRLGAYVEGYPARIAESLAEAFPAVAKITGNATFTSLARRYAAQLTVESKLERDAERSVEQQNLTFIGAGLAAFLRDDPLSDRLPFLCDLAEIEWAVVTCFHSDLLPPIDLSQCANWSLDDWANARIRLQPGVRALRSNWPLRDLRAARDVEASEIDVDLVDRPDWVLVYRSGFDVVTEGIDALECHAVAHFDAEGSLGKLMNRFAEEDADAERASALIARWTALGLVVGCERDARRPIVDQ